MNGSMVSPQSRLNVVGGQTPTTSDINAIRIGAVAEKLNAYVSSGQAMDGAQFINLCFSLARGIDYAVANNEIPATASALPPVFKQVCERRNEYPLLASVMVLMVSVKSACKIGWFTSTETEDLLLLADEVARNFSTEGNSGTEPTTVLPAVSSIMSKFYPRFKIGHLLASLDVQPGYGAYVVDFHIPKSLSYSREEKIRLFVAQIDNADTSSCLIGPPLVNFLLNGKGIERRTNVTLDQGPQVPTPVNHLLKYGSNLLQAVGQFDGHYVILIAFMSLMPSDDLSTPEDYIQPVAPTLESDSEIMEGASRISLNCPISCKRIRLPVKGRLCKHHQCFDLTNYTEINSRRPSWRCPHCNQPVCYTDIRIDQKMVKILKEVEKNVINVVISADGSWKAASNLEGGQGDLSNKDHNGPHEGNDCQSSPMPVDLTEVDDEIQEIDASDCVDKKPLVNAGHRTSSASTSPALPSLSRNSPAVTCNTIPSVTSVRSSTFLPNPAPVNYCTRSDARTVQGTPVTFVPSPVLTDAVPPAPNQVADAFNGNSLTGSMMSNGFQDVNISQLQQSRFGQSGNTEFRFPPSRGSITRTPIAIQALPVPTQLANSHQRLRSTLNNLVPNGSNASPQQRHLPQSSNPTNVPRQSPLSQNQSASQARTTPVQLPSGYRQAAPHLMRSSHGSTTQAHLGVSSGGISHVSNTAQQMPIMCFADLQSTQLSTHTTRQPPTVPLLLPTSRSAASMATPIPTAMDIDGSRTAVTGQRVNAGGTPRPLAVSRAENLIDLQSENWRPTGRMRGSLSGRAYSEALNQLIIQPTQPSQPTQTQGPAADT